MLIAQESKRNKKMTRMNLNQIVTAIDDEGEVIELYPTGEKEFNYVV